ncbi:putative DNA-binding protein [Nocardia nova SH22a]|uniref:Putative DNA-binding protein n=1 Tax=Nocardia nova SH22a TaxID=1415166 RepID=W5TAY3_9NOCA|nr:helix-turn-helix transcriptional regulator [Nocardia nova]AHH16510.1 putative DNA-binding protein [Nocardia nova SH22a]
MAGGSTLPRRALGRQLKAFRERKGLSQGASARIMETSPQTYGRLEEGRTTKVTDLALNALADAFGCDNNERRLLLDLAQEIRTASKDKRGWWRSLADAIPMDFNHYLSLEEAAEREFSWQTTIIPGLLHTTDYRREVTWAAHPQSSPEEIERIGDITTRRQDLLTRDGFRFEPYILESVLYGQVGSPAVMGEQLGRLLELSELPNVDIRIVPLKARHPIGLVARSFVYLEFPPLPSSGMGEPPVVYIEGLVGGLYLESDPEVGKYSDVVRQLQAVALSESESRDLISAAESDWR